MDREKLRALLTKIQRGKASVEQGLRALASLPFRDLGFARVDTHRALRTGFPEVIFCQGKTPAAVAGIAREILGGGHDLLATRADRRQFAAVKRIDRRAEWHEAARAITVRRKSRKGSGLVVVCCAGTSDLPVAEEARLTAEMLGARVERLYDVGVAGIHRVLSARDLLTRARAIVAVAGMEGALASVVGGLVSCPVIAVPTSVGYGASFGGLAALLAMLNSCAAGVTVVNIDNGFGAGYAAALINRTGSPGF
ncbi:MAG: nickel pincer cofactor biosynthesis protein LarB [Planctomycetota bacterium]|mgnify:CR=1 FL=1